MVKLEDQKVHTDVKQHNQELKFEWYKDSSDIIPEKFKLQYVQVNAKKRNQELIFGWYDESEKLGLITEKFKLLPEPIIIKETIEDQPKKKKSFHKRRK